MGEPLLERHKSIGSLQFGCYDPYLIHYFCWKSKHIRYESQVSMGKGWTSLGGIVYPGML